MTLDTNWFTEIHQNAGSAFSLEITGKIDEVQTPFQHIEMYDTTTFGKLMIIDGCTMVSTRDNFLYHEMMTHPALFTHPNPKKVLIIGGGDCGTLREVLKHQSVEKAWQVDIDEQVTRMAEKYFPELCESNEDPRAELLFIDGIKWIQDAEAGSLDLIIVDSTDPVGPAEGLFGEAFYRDCVRALDPENGMLVQQSESPLLHLELMQAMQKAMEDAGFESTQAIYFPQPLYPSGWWSATMAGAKSTLSSFREADAANKGFPTVYYNVDIHRGALAQPEFCKEAGLGLK